MSVAAAPTFRAGATHTRAENISRTSNLPEQRDADLLEASLSATQSRQLSRDWFAWLAAEASTHHERGFSLTDRTRLGVRAGARRKFGLGPQALTLDVDAAYAYQLARYDGDRGWRIETNARLSKRLGDNLRLGLSGGWRQTYARHAAFDLRQREAAVDVAWDFADGWQLTAGAGRFRGDITANASGPTYASALAGAFGPAVQAYYSVIPFEQNNLYGPNWISYRVQARGDPRWLGLSYALTESTSLTARFWTIEVINRVDVSYETDFWSLSLAHRF